MRSSRDADTLSGSSAKSAGVDIAINFEIDDSGSWFTSFWTGPVTDEEALSSYSKFMSGDEWKPEMCELVDLSDADMSGVTADGLAALAEVVANFFNNANVTVSRTAVYSSSDLPFGLARLYEAYTYESPESVQVFRDRDEALRWLAA